MDRKETSSFVLSEFIYIAHYLYLSINSEPLFSWSLHVESFLINVCILIKKLISNALLLNHTVQLYKANTQINDKNSLDE